MNKKTIKIDSENLILTIDEPRSSFCLGGIILTPAFGVAAKRIFPLSYFLTLNGFRVFRIDFRNHVGLSSGEIIDAKISTQVEDILAAVHSLDCHFIVSLSLSVRAAIRACALITKPIKAVFIVPVVDVRYTLKGANGGTDLFEVYYTKPNQEGADVLGYYVKRELIKDCLEFNLDSWRDTAKDIALFKGPASFIAGNQDPWVNFEHVKKAAQNYQKDINIISVEAASHKIDRNPKVALTYFEYATRECLRLVGRKTDYIITPSFREIIKAANF